MSRRFHEDFPITALLLLLVVGFFALELLGESKFGDDPRAWGRVLHNLGALDSRLVRGGEVWRLLSCAFLHGGLMHVFFSVWIIFDIGRFCEPLLSSPKFFTVYVLCGLGGSTASLIWFVMQGGGVSVGASGALFGLIGLLLVYAWKERHHELKQSLLRWIGMILVVTVVLPFLSHIRVDHAAHAGGFVVGGLLGLTVKDYMTSSSARRWRLPSYAVGAVLGISLLLALYNYFSKLWELR